MNKKTVGIVSAVVIVIITIVVAVFLMGKKQPSVIDSPDDLAKTMHENDPSKTIDEWKDIGNQELTDEQKQVADEIFADPVPEIDKIISIDEETNEITFEDPNGEEWVMEADPEIANMTDEEANAYTQQILDSLGTNTDNDDGRVDFGQGSVTFPSDNQGNQGNQDNQGQPQIDTNYEDVEIDTNDGLDWDSGKNGSGDDDPILSQLLGGNSEAWDPFEGLTPEEKEAAIKANQEATQKVVDGITGSMS